ncbi:hypothetical protein HMPREF3107_08370 [Neisseria sp. HMSC31F04]|nr:hypothetical protein HMPREF3107_08370 [Neisseria sp. HMSC31F04]
MHHCALSPILLSRPCNKFKIFALWRNSTNTATAAVTATHDPCGIKNHAAGTLITVATKAASDETLKPNAITSHTNAHTKAVGHDKASNTPKAVATPLPPLKPKNNGHICPTKAASAVSPTAVSLKPKTPCKPLASSTANKPFNASPNKVSTAAFFLPLLNTLVAPGFPEP